MDFKTYENQLNEPYIYNPIDISVGFYGLFSYRNNAWDHVLERIRKYYPDAPIVLINDGTEQFDYSEMAKKYNCIFVPKNKTICTYFLNIGDCHEFLHRTKEACDLVKTEWIIHLHPDVICQGKISYYPPSELCGVGAGSTTGKSANNWRESWAIKDFGNIPAYIRKFQSNVEINGWGWCGGSIMKCDAFYKVYDSVYGDNPICSLDEINKETQSLVTTSEDTIIPLLFNINGYSYRIWKDNPEYHRGRREGAFLHGYKEHYGLKAEGLSISDYYKKLREETVERSLKNNL
jgi:hypothetical protein